MIQIGPSHPEFDRFVKFTERKYLEVYGARIQVRDQRLMLETNGDKHASIFVRGSSELFSEKYLHQPIEELIAIYSKTPVDRCCIVELGSFAATDLATAVDLFRNLARQFRREKIAHILLTVPRRFLTKFTQYGVDYSLLAMADEKLLGADQQGCWGNYYQGKPTVVLISMDRLGKPQLSSSVNSSVSVAESK